MCTEREGKKQSLSEERAHSPFHEIESKWKLLNSNHWNHITYLITWEEKTEESTTDNQNEKDSRYINNNNSNKHVQVENELVEEQKENEC